MYLNLIRNIIKKYPKISRKGYDVILKYWQIKSYVIKYDYPVNNINSLPLDEIKEYNKLRIFGPKKQICYAPFNNLHFQMDGNVTLCSFNNKMLIGNVEQQRLKDIWSSSKALEFRLKMADFNLDSCNSCKLAFNFKNYSSFPAVKYDLFSEDNASFPTQMSFELSNICNYECIMCNEELSSSIRKKMKLPAQFYKYPFDFIDQLREFIPHLKIATFIGGEPFLIKTYFSIWEEICKLNRNCIIHIQTNGSYIPNKFFDIIKNKNFEIGVSLDALNKDLFERIRINSNFDLVFQNLVKLIEYNNKGMISLNINYCLMNINWKELPKILSFCNQNRISLKIIHVNMPYNFDIKNMPPDIIENIYTELLAYSNNFNNSTEVIIRRNNQSFLYSLNNIKSFIHDATIISSKIEQLVKIDCNELKSFFYKDLFSINTFSTYNHNTKVDFYNYSLSFIDKLTKDVVLQKCIYARMICYFNLSHPDIGSELKYIELERLILGFYELEKLIIDSKYNI